MTGRGVLLVVALLVVTSGCVGLGGGDGPAATPSAGGSSGSSGSGDTGGTGGSGGGSSDAGGSGESDGSGDGDAAGFQPVEDFEDIRTDAQMSDYVDRSPYPIFRPGEYFVYEGTNGFGDEPVPVRMEIQSVGGGEWLDADLEITLTKGGETNTYSAADGSIGRILMTPEVALTQNGRAWIWLYRYNLVTNVDPRISELSVGDTWRYDQQGQPADEEPSGFTFEVTEQRQFAGQTCLVVVTDIFEGEESRTFSESCVSPDIGMPLYYVMYQDDDDVLLEMELVEYQR
jgi:hypothetical protein